MKESLLEMQKSNESSLSQEKLTSLIEIRDRILLHSGNDTNKAFRQTFDTEFGKLANGQTADEFSKNLKQSRLISKVYTSKFTHQDRMNYFLKELIKLSDSSTNKRVAKMSDADQKSMEAIKQSCEEKKTQLNSTKVHSREEMQLLERELISLYSQYKSVNERVESSKTHKSKHNTPKHR